MWGPSLLNSRDTCCRPRRAARAALAAAREQIGLRSSSVSRAASVSRRRAPLPDRASPLVAAQSIRPGCGRLRRKPRQASARPTSRPARWLVCLLRATRCRSGKICEPFYCRRWQSISLARQTSHRLATICWLINRLCQRRLFGDLMADKVLLLLLPPLGNMSATRYRFAQLDCHSTVAFLQISATLIYRAGCWTERKRLDRQKQQQVGKQ